ncbi:four-carbon acid sugar kinase family protein [Paenibacillus sp. y28]|uniref:four-carbon acid sugar kinase family protein n=1 Tax=Paenibacillus sp. y28 TaxID=3129110 RepID=UPI00301907FE
MNGSQPGLGAYSGTGEAVSGLSAPLEKAHGQEQDSSRPGRLLCYYGDDFTGSTDVLESLFRAGLKTVLFLSPPSAELLQERFATVRCFGVAGVGRSLTPDQMEQELRPVLETLKTAGAAVVHYKVCSTFDSSPETGSIGKAAEIGRDVFGGGRYTPLLAGVPYLRRYTVFGHHFAAAGGEAVFRLDRHPTMSRHPVTPMAESDLREHLRKQTELPVSLLDIVALDGAYEGVRGRLEQLLQAERSKLVLFDVLDERRLETAGRLIWEEAQQEAAAGNSLFVVGSSGVEYALASWWKTSGLLNEAADAGADGPSVGEEDRLLTVSGSCSPVTERQIQAALRAGHAGIRVPADQLLQPETSEAAHAQVKAEALCLLQSGRSVVLYTASGPQDESIGRIRSILAAQGCKPEESGRLLGGALGRLTRELVRAAGLRRIVIAGGDTSGYITRELGVYALSCKAALDPGAPLCEAYSEDLPFDGLELVLKGGQVGGEHFFEKVRLGGKAEPVQN